MYFETKVNIYKHIIKLLFKISFFFINNYIVLYIFCLFFLFSCIIYFYTTKNNIVNHYIILINLVCYLLIYLYIATLLVTMFYEFNNTVPYVVVANLFFFLNNGLLLYMDGLSLLFILLLSFLILICFVYYFYYTRYFMYIKISSFKNSDVINNSKPNLKSVVSKYTTSFCYVSLLYIILLLLVNLILFLLFLSTDFLVFYILFESILVPLFLLIGIYGLRNNKVKAVYFLIFFTVIGSFFFIFGTIMMEYLVGSTSAWNIKNLDMFFSFKKFY
jgi:NADH:ubiquinone oxidoreductase subunit 4 (subunit M)